MIGSTVHRFAAVCILLTMTGCTVPIQSETYSSALQQAVAQALYRDFVSHVDKEADVLKIVANGALSAELESIARENGYAISTETGKPVKIDLYYLSDSDLYIASLGLGDFKRITRKYEYHPEGLLQVGGVSMGY